MIINKFLLSHYLTMTLMFLRTELTSVTQRAKMKKSALEIYRVIKMAYADDPDFQ